MHVTRSILVLYLSAHAAVAAPAALATAQPSSTDWTLIPRTEPSPRSRHAMVYDTARSVALLFGDHDAFFNCGQVSFLGVQDVSAWDGTSWVHHAPQGPAPVARYDLALPFDSARGRAVLFGGATANGCDFGPPDIYLGDTWEWDGFSWFESAASAPAARRNHAMAFDAARGKVVLYGGLFETWEEGETYFADTWEWDGSSWTEIATSGPGPRAHHAMAYDSPRSRIVLFGGRDAGGVKGDTWEFDGEAWILASESGPEPRVGAQVTGKIVLSR